MNLFEKLQKLKALGVEDNGAAVDLPDISGLLSKTLLNRRKMKEIKDSMPVIPADPRDFTPPQVVCPDVSAFVDRGLVHASDLDIAAHRQKVIETNSARLINQLAQIKGTTLTPEAQQTVGLLITAQTLALLDGKAFDKALKILKHQAGIAHDTFDALDDMGPETIRETLAIPALDLIIKDRLTAPGATISITEAKKEWQTAGLPGQPLIVSGIDQPGQINLHDFVGQVTTLTQNPQTAAEWARASSERRERLLKTDQQLENFNQPGLRLSLRERILGPGNIRLSKAPEIIITADGDGAIAEKEALQRGTTSAAVERDMKLGAAGAEVDQAIQNYQELRARQGR